MLRWDCMKRGKKKKRTRTVATTMTSLRDSNCGSYRYLRLQYIPPPHKSSRPTGLTHSRITITGIM